MAAKYRKVDPRVWTDEKFVQLNPQGKLLALWLLTCHRLNRCGIVQWSAALASEETGIDRNEVDTVFDTVCDTLCWPRDTVSRVVFLRRWWRYNCPDNAKALKGAMRDLHDLPQHTLNAYLREASEDLKPSLQVEYLTVFDTLCHTSNSNSNSNSNSSLRFPSESALCETDDEPTDDGKPKKRFNYGKTFEVWWQAYPKERRVGKKKTYDAWKAAGKRLRDEHDWGGTEAATYLQERVEAYAASPAARRTKYVPHSHRWLEYARYDDDPQAWQDHDGKTNPHDGNDGRATF